MQVVRASCLGKSDAWRSAPSLYVCCNLTSPKPRSTARTFDPQFHSNSIHFQKKAAMNSQRGSSRRGRGSSSSGRGRVTSSSSSRVRRGRGRGRGSYYNRSNGATSRNSSFRAQRQPSVTPSTASRLTTPHSFNNSRQPSSAPSVVYQQPSASVTPSQPRDRFDDGASDETLDEIIMAVDMKPRGTVGCAYYVAAQEKLYFMEDIELGGPDVIEARKLLKYPSSRCR